jgi:PPK2 family polyphosphate:nucleotide phosphotransferase
MKMQSEISSIPPVHEISSFNLCTLSTQSPGQKALILQNKLPEIDESFFVLEQKISQLEKGRQLSLLLILQGMDASGKDSAIRALLKGLRDNNLRVEAFREPSHDELQHDFLWRVHQKSPAKGEVVIFNRSHYEDVLVARVRGGISKNVIEKRIRHIVNFESLLIDHQVIILKCFLHITKEEQRLRLQARLDDPSKHGKLNRADFQDRERWDDYMQAYDDALKRTSSEEAPWYVIPSDHKVERDHWLRTILISRLMNHLAPEAPFNAD